MAQWLSPSAFDRMKRTGSGSGTGTGSGSGSSGSSGSHALKYRSSATCEFDGEDIGLERCPTSQSLPHCKSNIESMSMGVGIACSLPVPSLLQRRAKLDLSLELSALLKPVDPITEETPATPATTPPPEKPKWRPSRKKTKLPEEPVYPVWNTSSNKRYDSYVDYSKSTNAYRKQVFKRGNGVAQDLAESGLMRDSGILKNVRRVRQDPEQAERQLTQALDAGKFAIPPTTATLLTEGIGYKSLSALKGKYWYSIHTPINAVRTYSMFRCTETNRAVGVEHVTRHYLMKILKKVNMDARAWENAYLDLELLRKCKHENCVSLVEMLQTDGELHMVMAPYLETNVVAVAARGGMSGRDVQHIMRGAARALMYLHEEMGVAYCGLQGTDLLCGTGAGGSIKLSDFSHIRCIASHSPINFSFKRVSRRSLEPSHLVALDVITLGSLLFLLYNGSIPLSLLQDAKFIPSTPSPLLPLLKGTCSLDDFVNSPWMAREPLEQPSLAVDNAKEWTQAVRADSDALIRLLFSSSLLDRA